MKPRPHDVLCGHRRNGAGQPEGFRGENIFSPLIEHIEYAYSPPFRNQWNCENRSHLPPVLRGRFQLQHLDDVSCQQRLAMVTDPARND